MNSALFIDKAGDLYYVGNLARGKALATLDRTAHETTRTTGEETVYIVELSDCGGHHGIMMPCPDVAEWGVSMKGLKESWRYAIAAQFGPVDEEYMGDVALLRLLNNQKVGEE